MPKQLYLRELLPRAPALESLLGRFATFADARRGHGLKHRQRFVLACAAVSTLIGACVYRALENNCQNFTLCQLRVLGWQRKEADHRYYPPSDSIFLRVLQKLDAGASATRVGGWLAKQEIGAGSADRRWQGAARQRPPRWPALAVALGRDTSPAPDAGQIPNDAKSKEIPALQRLLKNSAPPPRPAR